MDDIIHTNSLSTFSGCLNPDTPLTQIKASARIWQTVVAGSISQPHRYAQRFGPGEISNFPEVLVDGVSTPTQTTVLQRHSDGSVKHAIMCMIAHNITSVPQTITYRNDPGYMEQGFLSLNDMLSPEYNFDPIFEFNFGSETVTVSGRDMLISGHWSYWHKGPLCTGIILSDHSSDRIYDVGSDQHKSVRPLIHAEFWHQSKIVRIRFIAECSNTIAVQDQTYSIRLLNGNSVLYSKATFMHYAATRWTKVYTINGTTSPLNFKFDTAHMTGIRAWMNYSPEADITESTISSQYTTWLNSARDITDKSLLQVAMGSAGGRHEIGPYPTWTVRWMLSGDWRFAEIVESQISLAGNWPLHYREGDSTRIFDDLGQVPGIGRITSINQGGRPGIWIPRIQWHEVPANSRINPITPYAPNAWKMDVEHHPDLYSVPYMLTGDYFYLEQLLFWSAYITSDCNAAGRTTKLGRGWTGSEGIGWSGEKRAQGWRMRTRANHCDVIPESMPEKRYFDTIMLNTIIAYEGFYNITNSPYITHHLWAYGRAAAQLSVTWGVPRGTPSPLGFWERDIGRAPNFTEEGVDYNIASDSNSPFMLNYVIIGLGRARELGWPTDRLLEFIGRTHTGPASTPGYDLELISLYRVPSVSRLTGTWFQSWTETYSAIMPSAITKAIADYRTLPAQDPDHGYDMITMAASSYLYHLNPAIFDYYYASRKDLPQVKSNPKWLILPR